jgi:hypothetical protein
MSSDATTFPTTIDSFLPVEETHLQVGKIHSAIVALETKAGIGALVGTDISATGPVVIGGGTIYEIGSLAGNIVLTFGTTGAVEGHEITLVRTGTTAHTVQCINGGAGAGTMCTLPASTAGVATFVYVNANWRLKHVSLFPLYEVGGPLTATANADGFDLSGGTTPRTLTLTGGAMTLTAAAAGVGLNLASNLTTTGAFTSSFTQSANATFTLPGTDAWLMGSTGTAMVTVGNADGFSMYGGTTPRTLSLTGGACSITAAAAGVALGLASNFTTTGAFTTSLTQSANTTLALPGASGWLMGSTGTAMTTAGAADGFSISGGTTPRQFSLTGGACAVTAAAAGVALGFSSNFTTTGAFTTSLTQSANTTLALPGASSNLVGATGGVLSVVAAAAGSTLTMADDVEFQGAFKPIFVSSADATFTLPGASCTLADAAAGLTAQKLTATIGFADLTGAVAGAVETENIGAALPANARILGICSKLTTPFTGGGTASMDIQIGTAADIDSLVDSCDVLSAAVDGMPATQVLGAYPFKHYAAGAQMIATFTPDGGHATADTDAGSITIDILYTVVA